MKSLSPGRGQQLKLAAATEDWPPLDDAVFEYWAGNPSVEIMHGHIRTATVDTRVGGGAQGAACAVSLSLEDEPCAASSSSNSGSSAILASTVPCHMSAPEFCDFVGAFSEETHRRFRHCRVLHGRSPEEYLIALLFVSPEAAAAFVDVHNDRQYNALEPGICKLHRVTGWSRSVLTADAKDDVPHSPPVIARKGSQGSIVAECSPSRMPLECSPARVSLGSPAVGSCSPFSPSSELPDVLQSSIEDLFLGCVDAPATSSLASEKWFCAVCLENLEVNPESYQLTEMGGGMPLTILCGHTFHAKCLSRWCDASCPVCRFQQHPYQTSCCDVCGQSDGIHICLVCGFIGCSARDSDGDGHAPQHFEETRHTYALDVRTQRVWDYAGNGYVHRLLSNYEDGKVVEHSFLEFGDSVGSGGVELRSCASGGTEGAAAPSSGAETLSGLARGEALLGVKAAKKNETLVSEFNMLLASQMTAMRRYYEERTREQELEQDRELREREVRRQEAEAATQAARVRLDALARANGALQRDIENVSQEQEAMRRQRQILEGLNSRISQEQQQYEGLRADKEEQRRVARQQRDRLVQELQQQIHDLELYVQMRRKCKASADTAELQGSNIIVTEADRGSGRGGRGGGRGRRRK